MENSEIVAVEPKKEEPVIIEGTLDDKCLSLVKTAKPSNRGKLNRITTSLIVDNIAKGVSMQSSALYVGIAPTTLYNWFKMGQDEVDSLSEEQIIEAGGVENAISDYGKLYLDICRARSKCVIELHDMLYERAFESGKEWIATYLLERAEPEKYNLKYKVQQEVNANVSANVVEFSFVNGLDMRPEDEKEFILEKVSELKETYKDTDMVDASPDRDKPREINITPKKDEGNESN